MNEQLFQFIWAHALFDSHDLRLKDGRSITIIRPGICNHDAGPDFTDARIRIDNTVWAGNIELHLKEQDWFRHGHDTDPRYAHIILHVVLEQDITRQYGNFPVLVLASRIQPKLTFHYQQLMDRSTQIACRKYAAMIPPLLRTQWTDRLLHERWIQKTEALSAILEQNNQDWQQLLYTLLFRYLGTGANAEAFSTLALQTPYQMLARHRDNLEHLEALLYGQAGLIPEVPSDPYSIALSIHYAFYQRKYHLKPMSANAWKFSRMRPAHFPTIRIAQIAMLLHQHPQLFQELMTSSSVAALQQLLQTGVSPYWQQHYQFDHQSDATGKRLPGKHMAVNLIVNVIAPLRLLYTRQTSIGNASEMLCDWLQQLPPEDNFITRIWKETGYPIPDAYSSQAAIQLYQQYCQPKRCLHCSIGLQLLRS